MGHEGTREVGLGYAHCFVGAGGFLGPSLGGDFCAIVLTGDGWSS